MAKARRSKRRVTTPLHDFAEYFAWGVSFRPPPSGLAFSAKDDAPTRKAVRVAWGEHGDAFMRDWPEPNTGPWAAGEFGLPRSFEHLRFGHAY